MDVLDKYKKAWENQPEDDKKVSKVDIYKMTKLRSSSIVKWIFIIGSMEFLLWVVLNIILSKTKYIDVYSELNMLTLLDYSYYINLFVVVIFLFLFYKNYTSINTSDNTRSLMAKIIKTRKTVKYYVFYNIVGGILILIVFNMVLMNTPNGMETVMKAEELGITDPSKLMTVFIVSQAIVIAIVLAFLLVFYYLLYGILLRKLNKNYKELAKLESEE
jgi:magnesium-transporting ATPase (P-type)